MLCASGSRHGFRVSRRGHSKVMEWKWVECSLREPGLSQEPGSCVVEASGSWAQAVACQIPGGSPAGWLGLCELLPPCLLLSSELWVLSSPGWPRCGRGSLLGKRGAQAWPSLPGAGAWGAVLRGPVTSWQGLGSPPGRVLGLSRRACPHARVKGLHRWWCWWLGSPVGLGRPEGCLWGGGLASLVWSGPRQHRRFSSGPG